MFVVLVKREIKDVGIVEMLKNERITEHTQKERKKRRNRQKTHDSRPKERTERGNK
jgi:hypothetical protein